MRGPQADRDWVFVRNSNGWSRQAYLKASNTGGRDMYGHDAQDFFGTSVSVSGNTIVVGAYGEDSSARGVDGDKTDNNGPQSGAAYVFVRSSSVWTQQAYLKASNAEPSDFFGASVAVSGDTAVIGAFGAGGTSGGAANVFVRSGAVWSQQSYITASNPDEGDWFGADVAVSEDVVVPRLRMAPA